MTTQSLNRTILFASAFLFGIGCKPRQSTLSSVGDGKYPCQSLNTDNCDSKLVGRQVWQMSASIESGIADRIYYVFENKGSALTWQRYVVNRSQQGEILAQRSSGNLIHNSKFSVILEPGQSTCDSLYKNPKRERLFYYRIDRQNHQGNYESLLLLDEDLYSQYLDLQ